jgi:hypothetical protein
MQALGQVGEALSIGIALVVVYFLPALLAITTDHRQKAPILALNVLLGWTIIGWIAAMEWATRPLSRKQPVQFLEYSPDEPGPPIYTSSRPHPIRSRYD